MSRPLPNCMMILIALGLIACSGGENDASTGSGNEENMIGRFKIESVRLSVPEPLFVRIDSATGEVTQHKMLGEGLFQPVAKETPPGAGEELTVNRYRLRIVPGRRGAALMRLDTVTGRTWLLHLSIKPRRWEEMGYSEKPAVGSVKKPRTVNPNGQTTVPKYEVLVGLLTANPPDVRGVSASLLVMHYPEKAASPLLEALDEKDPDVLIAIVKALGKTKDPRMKKALEPLREHPEARVVDAVDAALAD